MKAFRRLLLSVLETTLRRPVALDPNVPVTLLLRHVAGTGYGLIRGVLLTGRPLVLGAGAKIIAPTFFKKEGGLVRIGAYSTVDCSSLEGIRVGRNFKLGAYSHMIASGTLSELGLGITIGDNVGISEFAYLGGAGGLRIGSDVIVGQYFSAHPENHIFSSVDIPIREQGVIRKGIKIDSDCWIGAKVTILDGVTLGRGCVVAAGSVVNRSFPEYSIIGGVPARILKMRKQLISTVTETTHDNSDDH